MFFNTRSAFPLLLAACFPVHAEIFVGLNAGLTNIEASNSDFRPWQVGLLGGMRSASGFGAELHVAAGVRDDDSNNSTMNADLLSVAYLTANSVSSGASVILTAGAGYGLLQTDTDTLGSGYPGSQTFDGPALLLRLEERLNPDSRYSLQATFEHMYLDDDLSVSNFSFGVNYAL
jgi:hypothetical protein